MSLALKTHTRTQFSIEKGVSKQTFNHESGRADVARFADGVWQVNYTGVMTPEGFDVLRSKVVAATLDAKIIVAHVERALLLFADPPPITMNMIRPGKAAAAVVVRRDQLAVWDEYAAKMDGIGIKRLIFLDERMEQVDRFVACLSGDHATAEWMKRVAKPDA